MSDAPLTTPAYTILRDAALATLEAGKIRAQQAVEQEKIRTGWEIGKMLHQHLLKNKDRAEYGERGITQPADDLEMGPQDCTRCWPFIGPSQFSARAENST
jgi:hypothetical protein